MQNYVRSGVAILNDITKNLKNLNNLGIYLSKQTDINALKTLKLLILASETKRLNKPFDINATNTYIYLKEELTGIVHEQKENIVGNLSLNPQNFALELMEYVIKNYPVNSEFECYGIYSFLEVWNRSFKRMEFNDMDPFYKRYDMIDKKMDLLEFMIFNGLLTKKQISDLLHTYKFCLDSDNKFSKDQLQRMQYTINQIEQFNELHKMISSLRNITKEEREMRHDEIDNIMGISRKPKLEIYDSCKQNAEYEIQNYIMQNDQCSYMLNTLPILIKKKL